MASFSSSIGFYGECVRMSRLCTFEGLVDKWPAKLKWNSGNQGLEYLGEKLNGKVKVFVNMEIPSAQQSEIQETDQWDSFKSSYLVLMQYSEFVAKLNQPGIGVALKDPVIYHTFKDDIRLPSFLEDFSYLQGTDIMQGHMFLIPPHYEKFEQFLCQIEGDIHLKLISPIYRQEVYAGQPIEEMFINEDGLQRVQKPVAINQSPVNFFQPDLINFPNFMEANVKSELIPAGDCIFIPAFYWYQGYAYNVNQN